MDVQSCTGANVPEFMVGVRGGLQPIQVRKHTMWET